MVTWLESDCRLSRSDTRGREDLPAAAMGPFSIRPSTSLKIHKDIKIRGILTARQPKQDTHQSTAEIQPQKSTLGITRGVSPCPSYP